MEAKVPPPPKFDLAASNFPPLPGSGVSLRGETTPEMRLSDVVRGLKVTNKVNLSLVGAFYSEDAFKLHCINACYISNSLLFQSVSQEVNETRRTTVSKEPVGKQDSVAPAAKSTPVTPQMVAPAPSRYSLLRIN